eukprot:COSAG01_NODE_4739_length_4782_cov_2.805467_3_plen_102_part_00
MIYIFQPRAPSRESAPGLIRAESVAEIPLRFYSFHLSRIISRDRHMCTTHPTLDGGPGGVDQEDLGGQLGEDGGADPHHLRPQTAVLLRRRGWHVGDTAPH